MFPKLFLFALLFLFSINIDAQSSEMAKRYFKAFKKKSAKPIAKYTLSAEENITILSWPKNKETLNYVDSLINVYEDSLVSSFHRIDLMLKKNGFNLKKSKLIKSEETSDWSEVLILTLSYRKKNQSIFIELIRLSEKSCVFSYPSLTPPTPVEIPESQQLNTQEKETQNLSEAEIYTVLEKKQGKHIAENFLLVKKERKKLEALIDSLRNQIIDQSGGYTEIDGRKYPIGKKDKIVPHKIFILEGKGKELQQKIISFENRLLSLVEDEERRELFKKELPMDNYLRNNKEEGDEWAKYLFDKMPVAAIFPMLRKFQNDVKTSEIMIINYLLKAE